MIDTIVFDWKRTLYDPERRKLIYGAKNLLEKLRNYKLILYGKGSKDEQKETKRLGVLKYFSSVVFVSKKTKAILNIIDPKSTVFIGDRRESEIKLANEIGAKSIWIKVGKFADEQSQVQPTFTMGNI